MKKDIRGCCIIAVTVLALLSCSDDQPVFHGSDSPLRLSDWNVFSLEAHELRPNKHAVVFRPANQLFTDYAHKLRTLWIPDGTQARLQDGEIDYPAGTILTKTFYYPTDSAGNTLRQTDSGKSFVDLSSNILVETRLLVKRKNSWKAFPYVWNEEQNEAFLRVAGASSKVKLKSDNGNLEFVYFIPNENQCSGCHVTKHPDGGMHPLGATASQLSTSLSGDRSQTLALVELGWLDRQREPQPIISWQDENSKIDERALAYLNMHCGHCHNPNGAADTSALLLDGSHRLKVHLGVCKTPVAAGGGASDMLYSIVPGDPARSILHYRMQSIAPDEMMPELGRSLVHQEGIDLIYRWISEMPGSCPN